MQNERDLGAWILPQPVAKTHWVNVPKYPGVRVIPFGYKESEDDPDWLEPIPFELESLEKAKEYLKQYGRDKVAHWLSKVTGRKISGKGLHVRVRSEIEHKRRSTFYKHLTRRLKKALNQAQAYERSLGKEGKPSLLDIPSYVALRDRADEYLRNNNSDT